MKKTLLVLTMLIVSFSMALAQEHRVSGKVTGSDGTPLPGITVQVKGTNTGTATNAAGEYELSVPDNATLVFRGIGFIEQSVKVGNSSTLTIALESGTKNLNELVVTALGIKREEKSLGYAQQQVGGDELSKTTETNVLNSLSGRVAGAQITASSGAVGASTRIVLRGNNSFSNNQPLFVVDGIPVSNYTTSMGAYGNVDYGNGIADIDPNNIASVSILKGANAAAIYGSSAANGAIVITTKTGKGAKGIGLSYSGAVTFEQTYILPRMQNKYGQGYGGGEYQYGLYKQGGGTLTYQDYALENSFAYVDGLGSGVNDNVDESWGPRLDIGLKLPQYNSSVTNGVRTLTPWVSHPNNFKDFFQTGHTIENNIAMTSNSEKSTIRLSLTDIKQVGTVPNTDQERNAVELTTSFHLTDKLTANAFINYVRLHNDNLQGDGYNTFNPMQSLGSWFGRQVDIHDLKANWQKEFANGYPYNWNSAYHDNPYFNVYKNIHQRMRDRVFGNVNLEYTFSPWAKLMGRVGTDWFSEDRKTMYGNKGNITLLGPGIWSGGEFNQSNRYLNETNADLILTGQGALSQEFSFNYTLGANYGNYSYKSQGLSADALTVPDLFTIANVNGQPGTSMYEEHLRSNSVYGQASLGYKGWLYLDVTGRNDWNSTLPSNNWSYFYPSVSLSWIFTDALNIQSNVLSFGKLRASWAQVGNATSPYQLYSVYNPLAQTFNGVTLYNISKTLPPLNLKPEAVKSTEFGLDLRFLDSRIDFDATYYNKVTTNQIMNVNLSTATGYGTIQINAGEIESKGLELHLAADILRSDNGLNWRVDINWAKNNSKVNKLYTDPNTGQKLESYNITQTWSTTIDAIPGKAFGAIRGKGFLRDSLGRIIVNKNGLPRFTSAPKILGNINPDWIGGISNSFSYKGINLSFLVDFRKGGDLFSVTDWFSSYTGVLSKTAVGTMREKGIVVGQDVLKGEKVVTLRDGKYVQNDIRVSAEDYWHSLYGGRESGIIDGSFIKLREFSLSYTLPAKIYRNIKWLREANIQLIGRNLALLYTDKSNDAHIDPEAAMGSDNAGLGVEQYQIPSNRSLGVRLNLTF